MKKKIIIVSVILFAAFMGFLLWRASSVFRYDKEKKCVIVKGKEYRYAKYQDHVELLKYTGDDVKITVPDTLMNKPVTVIGAACFKETPIETVRLGENIQEIRSSAFMDCNLLENISGPVELTEISNCTFWNCYLLENVDLGNSLTRIGRFAFLRCRALQSIGEHPDLQIIDEFAFAEAGALSDFVIPSTAEIGWNAFDYSEWLANQTEEFLIVGNGTLLAYRGDSDIVHIPEGVKKIDNPFDYKKPMKEVYIPDTVTALSNRTLTVAGQVTAYIPASVIEIAEEYEDDDGISFLAKDIELVTIVTTSGSYAEEYAKKYGIKCVIVESLEGL